MTSRATDVSVTLVGKDRLSPVLQNARRNMGRMSSSAVQLGTSMQALGSQASGVLGPMVGLVGGMGVLGLAVTGVGVGLALGVKRLRAWRAETKAASEAAEGFRSRLLLSGFSADDTRRTVDELRSSLGRLAFQALPGLDFELQGFIANMDAATQNRFSEFVDTLTDRGIGAAAAMQAIGEALQGNFGPISQLLNRPITSFQEFTDALGALRVEAVILETDVLKTMKNIASGTLTATGDQAAALNDLVAAFEDNRGQIAGVLAQLTEDERQALLNFLEIKIAEDKRLGIHSGNYADTIDFIARLIDEGIADEKRYSAATAEETERRIKEIERFNPALGREIRARLRLYNDDKFALAVLREVVKIEFERIKAEQSSWVDSLKTETEKAEGFLQRLERALARARAAALGSTPVPAGRTPGVPRPTVRPTGVQGNIFDRLREGSRLPTGSSTPLTIQIGDQVVREVVLDVLNDEVTLTNPSGGIG